VLHKFLHHIDNRLDIILKAYNLPLFVLGTEKVLGHFKTITRHGAAVIDYVPGNFEELTPDQLKKKLEPYLSDWHKVMQKNLMNKLEDAAGRKKLAIGINNVWREAMHRKGHLLAVEKNFMYPAEHIPDDEIQMAVPPYHQFSYVKDAVDDIIEKVLENGGDVEFVDEDVLKNYQHIAMVQHY
jgi:hypothetical protein